MTVDAFVRWFSVLVLTESCYLSVAEKDGELIGTAAGELVPYRMCFDEQYATDDFFYVRKPWRGSWCVLKLLKDFEKWAFAQGAREIRLATTASSFEGNERSAAITHRLGYKTIGYVVQKINQN